MDICAVIAEYNPFHNGHKYHIQQTNSDFHVAVMSGNFVQRGEYAIFEKRYRTKTALEHGIDLVIELPLPYAMASAERFAFGACEIIKGMGCINSVSFGSETNIQYLVELAKTVENAEVIMLMRSYLKQGLTFAKARALAIGDVFGKSHADLLKKPNTILAIEYMRKLPINIDIKPVMRIVEHDSENTSDIFACASHIRAMLQSEENVDRFLPYTPYSDTANQNKMELAILSHLRRKSDFHTLPDISEGIENRLYNAVRQSTSLREIISSIKTKRYTLSRVRRLVLSAFLDIDGGLVKNVPPYIRILGFNEKGKKIMQEMKKTASLPFSTSLATLEKNKACASYTSLEAHACDIYTLALPQIKPCGYDYTEKAVIL